MARHFPDDGPEWEDVPLWEPDPDAERDRLYDEALDTADLLRKEAKGE